MSWIILILGICANAFASILIKMAVTTPRKFPSFSEPMLALANWPFWLGLILYGAAFLLYSLSLIKLPLSVAHPTMTTGAVTVVVILSIMFLKEQFYWSTAFGIVFIVVGIFFISYRTS